MFGKVLTSIFPQFNARLASPATVRTVDQLVAVSAYQSVAGRDILSLLERSNQCPVTCDNIDSLVSLLARVHITACELRHMRDLALFWVNVEGRAGVLSHRAAWERLIHEIDWLLDAKSPEERDAAFAEPVRYNWTELAA